MEMMGVLDAWFFAELTKECEKQVMQRLLLERKEKKSSCGSEPVATARPCVQCDAS